MPVTPTYPGVYIEEIPSGVRTITGVATSITAFIGRARRGPATFSTALADSMGHLLWDLGEGVSVEPVGLSPGCHEDYSRLLDCLEVFR